MFTISIAFILLAMAKERTEFRHRTAAMVDPLTGIANRRSFLNDATELTNRHAATAESDGGAADGPRSFQVDQRPLRSRHRRPRAADLRREHAGDDPRGGSVRPARRRGIRGGAPQRQARGRDCAGGEHPPALRRSGGLCRRLCGRCDRQHRRRAQPGHHARHAGAAGAGRPGALLRQGARPQPGRGRDLRPHSQAQGTDPDAARRRASAA